MNCELIDYMGSDLTVVNAARVSFDKESDWEIICDDNGYATDGVDLSEKDQKLIKYLATHGHWTPFSHVMITMRETVPIFVARQRFKHMVGFTYNEVSRRYVDTPPEFYYPDLWRMRAENKKQGSSNKIIEAVTIPTFAEPYTDDPGFIYSAFITTCKMYYEGLINSGVAPEQARMVLPQSMYTSYYVTGSLAAWSRAYKLRIDEHAQKEIVDLAKMWYNIIYGIDEMRHSWQALTT